jgi:hypothetical protein
VGERRVLAGYSYRRAYAAETYANRERIDVLEIVADHFFDRLRECRRELEMLAEHFTLVPHGLDLSLGSAEGLNEAYLTRFADVVRRSGARRWSEHVAFTRAGGISIGHLAPLPYTRETLDVLERNLERARRAIGDLPCALENIAAPIALGGEFDEPEFLSALVARTGCKLLLDVENVHANALNFQFDADAYLDALPRDAVVQLHLAGGEWNGATYVDSHARTVSDDVWRLTRHAYERFAPEAAIVERDEDLPPFAELLREIEHARELGALVPACP